MASVPRAPAVVAGSIAAQQAAAQQTALRQQQAHALAAQQQQQLIQQMRAAKRPRLERRMPPRVEAIVPESRLYTDMVQAERKIDAMVLRKWIEREEASRRPSRVRRTLRVFFSNLAANQAGLPSDSDYDALDAGAVQDAPQPPSWTLRIEGRLLEPTLQALGASGSRRPVAPLKFSQLVRRLVVELERDPGLYPDGNLVEWMPTVDHVPVDGFEVKRTGDQNVNVRVLIELNHQPSRFKVHPLLAQHICVYTDTRAAILAALYQYIRARKLQKPDDRNVILFDDNLKQVFGRESAVFADLSDLISLVLSPPDPVLLTYTVRTDTDFFMPSIAYDIEFDLQDSFATSLPQAFSEFEQRELTKLDGEIALRLQHVQQSKLKREFMLAFAASPAYFIHAWLDAQARDQKTTVGDTSLSVDEQRRASLFAQPWVNEAAAKYLSDLSAKRTEELMRQVHEGTAHLQ